MDWIHCNKCFKQLEPGIALHLTSCGHMFCNNCLDNGEKDVTCVICRMPCSIMKLVPDMKPEIQEYFTEPEEIIRKSCEVLQFQGQHRRRLISYLLQSTKKFYAARTELRRMSELCQKQHKQLRDQQRAISSLQEQLAAQSRQTSPYNLSISSQDHVSPSYIQSTPTYKRPAKSTPYSPYQSALVTPARVSKQRSGSFTAHSQRSNNSNKISSTTVFTPPTPPSAGSHSPLSNESGFFSTPLSGISPTAVYCNGHDSKCSFRNRKKSNTSF